VTIARPIPLAPPVTATDWPVKDVVSGIGPQA
jgi:hypothetical protein